MGTVYRGRGPTSRVLVKESSKGHQRTLRVSNTLASVYTPGESSTGVVWEAMSLGVLLLGKKQPKVLVLGLAGASVVRGVLALNPRSEFVGIEIDAEVVATSLEWFDLATLPVKIDISDAANFIESSRRKFDLIIEDIFVGTGRHLSKPDWLPSPGLEKINRLLHNGGLLVSNSLDDSRANAAEFRRQFKSRVLIDIEGWDNKILIGSDVKISGRSLRRVVASSSVRPSVLEKLMFKSF